jgi:hypothetical protein
MISETATRRVVLGACGTDYAFRAGPTATSWIEAWKATSTELRAIVVRAALRRWPSLTCQGWTIPNNKTNSLPPLPSAAGEKGAIVICSLNRVGAAE